MEEPLPIRILIHGASGRMGRALLRLVGERPELQLVAAVSRSGQPLAEAPAGVPVLPVDRLAEAPDFDLAIDFSLPEGFDASVNGRTSRRPLSHWVRRGGSAETIAWDTAMAVAKASEHPGQIATLILPGDTAWQDAGGAIAPSPVAQGRKAPDPERIAQVAKVLRSGEPTMLILANKACRIEPLELAGKVAAGTGCRLDLVREDAQAATGLAPEPSVNLPTCNPWAESSKKPKAGTGAK